MLLLSFSWYASSTLLNLFINSQSTLSCVHSTSYFNVLPLALNFLGVWICLILLLLQKLCLLSLLVKYIILLKLLLIIYPPKFHKYRTYVLFDLFLIWYGNSLKMFSAVTSFMWIPYVHWPLWINNCTYKWLQKKQKKRSDYLLRA